MTWRKKPTEFARPWMEAFLVQLRKTGHVALSAEAASISRATVYWWRHHHEGFRRDWELALDNWMSETGEGVFGPDNKRYVGHAARRRYRKHK